MISIRRFLFLTLLLTMGCMARPMVVLAEPNEPCEQQFYAAPDWADPNTVIGIILPPIVTDPNTFDYAVPAGKLNRAGTWCDKDNDSVIIESRTLGWTVTYDDAGNWTLSGDVVPGPQYVYVRITDLPGPYREPKLTDYTVPIWGVPEENHAPILH